MTVTFFWLIPSKLCLRLCFLSDISCFLIASNYTEAPLESLNTAKSISLSTWVPNSGRVNSCTWTRNLYSLLFIKQILVKSAKLCWNATVNIWLFCDLKYVIGFLLRPGEIQWHGRLHYYFNPFVSTFFHFYSLWKHQKTLRFSLEI